MATHDKATTPLTPIDSLLHHAARDVHKVMFFETANADRQSILGTIRNGYDLTCAAIPGLNGVISSIECSEQVGRVAVTGPYLNSDKRVSTAQMDNLSYEAMKASDFPLTVCDIDHLWPSITEDPLPVLRAQVNFVNGGIIVTLAGSHAFMTGHGLKLIIDIWAAYCRGDDDSRYCQSDTVDRSRLMKGAPEISKTDVGATESSAKFTSSESSSSLEKLLRKSTLTVKSLGHRIAKFMSDIITYGDFKRAFGYHQPIPVGDFEMRLFFVSEERLAQLKQDITQRKSHACQNNEGDKAWISTHDGLVSLLWCAFGKHLYKDYHNFDLNLHPMRRIFLSFLYRTRKPLSFLAWFVDGRRFFTPPLQNYIGNCVITSFMGTSLDQLNTDIKSVANHAFELRQHIKEVDLSKVTSTIDFINSAKDVRSIASNPNPWPEGTILINSWANQDYYGTSWGDLLRRPQAVRCRPKLRGTYALVLPKREQKNGFLRGESGLEVAICLRKRHMQALVNDQFLSQWGKWT